MRHDVIQVKILLPRVLYPMVGPAYDAAFSPDGSRLLVIRNGCSLSVYDGLNGKGVAEPRNGIHLLTDRAAQPLQDALDWHPDGSRYAAVGQFGGIRIWDADTYELLQRYDGFQEGYGEVASHLMRDTIAEFGEAVANQLEAYRDQCIEELNAESDGMERTLVDGFALWQRKDRDCSEISCAEEPKATTKGEQHMPTTWTIAIDWDRDGNSSG